MPFLAIQFTKPRKYVHKAQWGHFPGCKGLVPKMQGDDFASEPGGIMEVAMWLCIPLLLGL